MTEGPIRDVSDSFDGLAAEPTRSRPVARRC